MTRCTDSIYCTGHVPCEGCLVCPSDGTPVSPEIRRMVGEALAAVTTPKPRLRVQNGLWYIVNYDARIDNPNVALFDKAWWWVRERNFKVTL